LQSLPTPSGPTTAPNEITLQIVKNTGNYESVRLQITSELLQTDDVENSFSELKELLEKSFRNFSQKETITVEKNTLKVGTSEFLRVSKAIKNGQTTIEEVQKHFILDVEAIKQLITL